MPSAEYQKQWKKNNRDKVRAANKKYAAKRRAAGLGTSSREYRQKLREKILDKFGRRCNNPACQWLNADGSRGCQDIRCLQIDHVHGGGKQELKSFSQSTYYARVLNDDTASYQLLCANCNWIKRAERGEVPRPRWIDADRRKTK